MIIGIYAAESALLRAKKLRAQGRGENARDMARQLVFDLLADVRRLGSTTLAASLDAKARVHSERLLSRLTECPALDTIALRRRIAERLIAAERFML